LVAPLLSLGARHAQAVSCDIVHHAPPTEADKALLAGEYDKAAGLYRADLAQHPASAALTTGLVHALLRQQKVEEAANVVKAALATVQDSPPLLTLQGEVQYRQGLPWEAEKSLAQSYKLDPCNPRTRLLSARLSRLSSRYASSREQILMAHKLDPADPEISSEWFRTLPLQQQIAENEAYLASSSSEDADDRKRVNNRLERLKKQTDQQQKACHLASSITSTEIPLVTFMSDATHPSGVGLDVKLNDKSAGMEIDTGAGGIVITRPIAERAGLKPLAKTSIGGIGDEGPQSSYEAYADSIKVGKLEFRDCIVEVVNSNHLFKRDNRGFVDQSGGGPEGLIGMDVFSHFLITLNYPSRKLSLNQLPARPGEEATAEAQSLNTGASTPSEGRSAPDTPRAGAQSSKAANTGPFDRYVAPEMKDYTPVYRYGHFLMLPTSLNDKSRKLFVMDTGAYSTIISPEAAREVTKLQREDSESQGLSGTVKKSYLTDDITLTFANLREKARDVDSFDTSGISRNAGIEISGFIGATTLQLLTIHIDYRDGLVKFDYDPKNVPGYRDHPYGPS
jgi:predicted aspartyl protease/Flp pilus assembly protein TadD